MVVGPIGRGLANGITAVLVWMTENLGVVGYSVFSAVQQLIVITGLHHVFGAIESQLLVDTGRNFLNPLMSVAMTAQGGAVGGAVVYFTEPVEGSHVDREAERTVKTGDRIAVITK